MSLQLLRSLHYSVGAANLNSEFLLLFCKLIQSELRTSQIQRRSSSLFFDVWCNLINRAKPDFYWKIRGLHKGSYVHFKRPKTGIELEADGKWMHRLVCLSSACSITPLRFVRMRWAHNWILLDRSSSSLVESRTKPYGLGNHRCFQVKIMNPNRSCCNAIPRHQHAILVNPINNTERAQDAYDHNLHAY